MRNFRLLSFVIAQSALLLQAGCGHFEPGKIVDESEATGPGLFSGEKGYFELELPVSKDSSQETK